MRLEHIDEMLERLLFSFKSMADLYVKGQTITDDTIKEIIREAEEKNGSANKSDNHKKGC